MTRVRLVREVNAPDGHGPNNGQCALQKALRAVRPDWFRIGGDVQPGEIPWFWSCTDGRAASIMALSGRPVVIGPNVLFADSRRPCKTRFERKLCNAPAVRLIFTESDWYAELIREHLEQDPQPAVVVWPYPIDPCPVGPVDGPADPVYDLLVFAKSGHDRNLVTRLLQRYRRSAVIEYGRFERSDLWEVARHSRACVYLSDDDRGPLALAEILLSGCPAVGVPKGAPWLVDDGMGELVDRLEFDPLVEAIDRVARFSHEQVRYAALARFDTAATVATIFAALDRVRAELPSIAG